MIMVKWKLFFFKAIHNTKGWDLMHIKKKIIAKVSLSYIVF